MKKCFGFLVFLGIVVAACPAPAATRSGAVTMEVDLSAHQTGKEVKLWLSAVVLCRNVIEALDLLLNPLRLTATLRG